MQKVKSNYGAFSGCNIDKFETLELGRLCMI